MRKGWARIAGRARKLAVIDQLLASPHVDRLIADIEISGDRRDATRRPAATRSRTLRRNSAGYLFGTELAILSGQRTVIIQ
jgi:hypothetical protein